MGARKSSTRAYLELCRTYSIEASHQLLHAPKGSVCRRLHGHSWRFDVHVAGAVNETTGWVIDYHEIDAAWKLIHEQLDHQHLNEVEGLDNPTSELLAVWVWERLAPRLAGLLCLTVHETCTARCSYWGPPPRGPKAEP